MIEIATDQLRAAIDPFGAELASLTDAQGRELMTDADPAYWAGRAPLLFPIVGRLNGDVLRVDGRDYAMKQHGFARRMTFEVVAHDAASATFRLTADDATRAMYPFEFVLDVTYAITGATLDIAVRVTNPGTEQLPMSLGFHPAFAWPLPYGAPRETHRITFAGDEPGAIVRLQDGLCAGERPSPLDGRTLALSDALFAEDALIWAPVASQSVLYGAPDGPQLRIDFADTPALGIWTKPGARFVCIEPWHGHADPAGFAGEFRDKPGVIAVLPRETWTGGMQVTLLT